MIYLPALLKGALIFGVFDDSRVLLMLANQLLETAIFTLVLVLFGPSVRKGPLQHTLRETLVL